MNPKKNAMEVGAKTSPVVTVVIILAAKIVFVASLAWILVMLAVGWREFGVLVALGGLVTVIRFAAGVLGNTEADIRGRAGIQYVLGHLLRLRVVDAWRTWRRGSKLKRWYGKVWVTSLILGFLLSGALQFA